MHPMGRLGRLPRRRTAELIERLAAAWSGEDAKTRSVGRLVQAQLILHMTLLRPLRKRMIKETGCV